MNYFLFLIKRIIGAIIAGLLILSGTVALVNHFNYKYNLNIESIALIRGFGIFIIALCVYSIYSIDMSNVMVSRLIINGGNRLKIWTIKGIATITSIVFMLTFIAAILRIEKYSKVEITDFLLASLLFAFFIMAITALVTAIWGNPIIWMFFMYIYVSNMGIILLGLFFENSKNKFLQRNILYMALKMYYSSNINKNDAIVEAVLSIIMMLLSVVIFNRKKLKTE